MAQIFSKPTVITLAYHLLRNKLDYSGGKKLKLKRARILLPVDVVVAKVDAVPRAGSSLKDMPTVI
jgi:hypothetical protein